MISAPTVRNQDFLYNTSLRAGAHTGVVYALRVQARSPQCLPLDKGRCPEGAEGSRAKHCRSPTAARSPLFRKGANATRGKRATRSLPRQRDAREARDAILACRRARRPAFPRRGGYQPPACVSPPHPCHPERSEGSQTSDAAPCPKLEILRLRLRLRSG